MRLQLLHVLVQLVDSSLGHGLCLSKVLHFIFYSCLFLTELLHFAVQGRYPPNRFVETLSLSIEAFVNPLAERVEVVADSCETVVLGVA